MEIWPGPGLVNAFRAELCGGPGPRALLGKLDSAARVVNATNATPALVLYLPNPGCGVRGPSTACTVQGQVMYVARTYNSSL